MLIFMSLSSNKNDDWWFLFQTLPVKHFYPIVLHEDVYLVIVTFHQVEMRAQLEKRMAQKEKTRKEELLKGLAKKAREEHAGLRSVPTGPSEEAEREREKLRQERARWE